MKSSIAMASLLLATAAQAQVSGQVTITAGSPDFYGRIEIGNLPRPTVIYQEPRIVRPPKVVVAEPLYLRVPPGHIKHWDKHCARYQACERRVYFVQEDWYSSVYAPAQRGEGRPDERGPGKDHGKGHGKHKD
ncbi:hypothetical protein [Massilia sp. TS11]|uniref:hypothetical protein n=1 Tax=Massilia sp. TS11 TaxID=2908003 RepID=UPI001EDB62B8|nr:hypothetical protein [Massilia sp. TS11]MCG2583397.1 hypothetical protein [Massilia sp. TS11]